MKFLIVLTIVVSLFICVHDAEDREPSSSKAIASIGKKKDENKSTMVAYKNYLNANRMIRKYYHSQFNHKLVKGKCKQTPIWSINGTYPILKEIKEGNAVFLFTMKKTCGKCWNELRSLHDWAKYYKRVGRKAKIIALMHRKYGKMTAKDNKQWFPYINIYNEPKSKNIFGQLKANVHDILMYDKCGRHQYHYRLPFSTMVEPYMRLAMKNTLVHYETFCGPCKPLVFPNNSTIPEEKQPPIERSITDIDGPNEDVETDIDGPIKKIDTDQV